MRSPPTAGVRLPDRIRPDLRVLLVGINPSLRSAALGHHFAGYSNRFWRLLHASGLTPKLLSYDQDVRLPDWGYGLTNIVARPTRNIDELAPEEYTAGRERLRRKIRRYRPELVATVGVTVYRALFPDHRGPVAIGPQPDRIGPASVFVLPNPSGRNAHYSYAQMLDAYRRLARALVPDLPQSGATPTPRGHDGRAAVEADCR